MVNVSFAEASIESPWTVLGRLPPIDLYNAFANVCKVEGLSIVIARNRCLPILSERHGLADRLSVVH
jgi:hypothetical protein